MNDSERMLSSSEVAALFRVSSRTVTAWANAGRLRSVRTPGGHHRFPASAVEAALRGEPGGVGRPRATAEPATAIDLTQPRSAPDFGTAIRGFQELHQA